MNRNDFRTEIGYADHDPATSFLSYFRVCLSSINARYASLNQRISKNNRIFDAVGVKNALDAYHWPADFVMPDGERIKIINWNETEGALSKLRIGLQSALADSKPTTPWTDAILKWGMGNRGTAAAKILQNPANSNRYLKAGQVYANLNGRLEDICANKFPKINSGISKIHSLSSSSGLIIYDSRVAFAIGECVGNWSILTKQEKIPSFLMFMQAGRRSPIGGSQLKMPRGYERGLKQPRESRNHLWLQTQLRASWLFEAALELEPTVFPGEKMVQRLHKLEAAFFMLGAYAETLQLPELQEGPKSAVFGITYADDKRP